MFEIFLRNKLSKSQLPLFSHQNRLQQLHNFQITTYTTSTIFKSEQSSNLQHSIKSHMNRTTTTTDYFRCVKRYRKNKIIRSADTSETIHQNGTNLRNILRKSRAWWHDDKIHNVFFKSKLNIEGIFDSRCNQLKSINN